MDGTGVTAGTETPAGRGLNPDGTIAREGALDRVPGAFTGVVAAARAIIVRESGALGLHSAHLYGSVPRGTAVPGVSDLDLLLILHRPPARGDRERADAMADALDRAHPEADGVGILLADAGSVLSEAERHDLGFFVACLCTPLLGEDLAARLPGYRPTSLLARETNGDLARVLPRWRERAAAAATGEELRRLTRTVARRIVRTGFTLVMPRWQGWTSDLERSAEIFARYHPGRAGQMRTAARLARSPVADPALLRMLTEDLGPWLAAEYTAAHGEKAPRP
ncbi:hypothetical protein GCM10009716_45210 [Streptomyces sodiiphilus]|uniref:Polymerase nucleotidyl transferase domain-containing protein n=1 Tax=Streptomyces sodiiphilus TaxID=226217 RepID=A0ABN2PU69_9ACTN